MLQSEGPLPPPQHRTALWFRPFFSLRWRLAFVYIALFGIFVAILSGFLYSSASALLYSDGKTAFPQRVFDLRAQFIRDTYCNNETLQNTNSFIGQENKSNDIDNIYILDASGRIVSSSNGRMLNQPFPYIDKTFFSLFHAGTTKSFQANTSEGEKSDGLLLSLQPPQNCSQGSKGSISINTSGSSSTGRGQNIDSSFEGYLAVTTSYSAEQATLKNLLTLIAVAASIMIILGAGVIFFLTGYMLRPLRDMANASQAIAQGDLQQRVQLLQSEDEVGTLALSFNQMITRIEHAFQVQQESERRTQRFVSDASHELRTPITSLRGFTEVLIRGAKDDPKTAEHVLNLMRNEAERMTRLVNDLLTLARLDEKCPLKTSDVDLVDIAIEAVQQAKKLGGEQQKISLDLATQERLQVNADSERIKHMILILLDNALKYGSIQPSATNEESPVILRLDKQDDYAVIQVIDKGPGISEEDIPHIFDRFYRGKNASRPRSDGSPIVGTGLGLAIAQSIVRAHHGEITVHSEPNKETVFTVTLHCID